MLVGAVGLLALGKPVTGGKRFPDDFTLTLPGLSGKKSLAQVFTQHRTAHPHLEYMHLVANFVTTSLSAVAAL